MEIETLMENIGREIINPLIYLLIALATLLFLWGVLVFILNADNEEKRRQGQQHIIWGVVGIVIMFGVYGILQFIANTLGVDSVSAP